MIKTYLSSLKQYKLLITVLLFEQFYCLLSQVLKRRHLTTQSRYLIIHNQSWLTKNLDALIDVHQRQNYRKCVRFNYLSIRENMSESNTWTYTPRCYRSRGLSFSPIYYPHLRLHQHWLDVCLPTWTGTLQNHKFTEYHLGL